MGWMGFSKVNGRLNCPIFTLKAEYRCHSANKSNTGTAAQRRGVAIQLNLSFPIELVHNSAVQRQPEHAQVESVGLVVFPAAVLILRHSIAGEFDIVEPGSFLLLSLCC